MRGPALTSSESHPAGCGGRPGRGPTLTGGGIFQRRRPRRRNHSRSHDRVAGERSNGVVHEVEGSTR